MNVANLYADPKTFVDKVRLSNCPVIQFTDSVIRVKPTNTSSKVVLAAFANLTASGNVTEQQLIDFVDTNFRGEGLELEALTLTNFTENPAFLKNVTDSTANAFAQKVHSFWTQLIRGTNATTLCAEGGGGKCESSLIPLNHTFVVPGTRLCPFILMLWLTLIFRWSIQRAVLLGQLLDCGRSHRVSTLRHCQWHASKLHGRTRDHRIHSEWWTNLLYSKLFSLAVNSVTDSSADLNRSQPPLFIQVSLPNCVSDSANIPSRCLHDTSPQRTTRLS